MSASWYASWLVRALASAKLRRSPVSESIHASSRALILARPVNTSPPFGNIRVLP